MSLRARVLLACSCNAALAVAAAFLARRLGVAEGVALVVGLFAAVPTLLWSTGRIVHAIEWPMIALEDGLHAFRDGDFSMRLTSAGRDRIAAARRLYNDVADDLRTRRNDVFQKELLLDTILQRTSMAVVLVTANDRIVYSNAAAREIFGGRLDGHLFGEVVERLTPAVREAVETGGNAIVTVQTAEQEETFHLSQKTFELNTIQHRLLLVERLTAELRRQEITVWKNAIRVINHELNNTIAPISSMIHSARIAQARPDHRHRLEEIYETIEERLAFLRTFLESYAQFARLPIPKKAPTSWDAVLQGARALYQFRVEGTPAEETPMDGTQMQQAIINLVKNAHESGSDPGEIVVTVQRAVEGTVVRVSDRGRGMTEEIMRQALVPFYSTKPAGSGLGLPLCNEIVEAHHGRMRLAAREGGGTVVTLWVPG